MTKTLLISFHFIVSTTVCAVTLSEISVGGGGGVGVATNSCDILSSLLFCQHSHFFTDTHIVFMMCAMISYEY